jgi:hypothetical protein
MLDGVVIVVISRALGGSGMVAAMGCGRGEVVGATNRGGGRHPVGGGGGVRSHGELPDGARLGRRQRPTGANLVTVAIEDEAGGRRRGNESEI